MDRRIVALMVYALLSIAGLASCGDGGGSVAVTGTWTGVVEITFDDSSHLSDNVSLVLSQLGAAVTGQITNSGGTLPVEGEVAHDSLAIHFTVPCNGGTNPKIAALTFALSRSSMTATSADNMACTKNISEVSGTLTKQ